MIFSLSSSADHWFLTSCVFMQHCCATKDAWRNKRFLWETVAGKLSLCLIYELSHNIFHILRTCCHCAESSAEDKLAFKWGKLFSFYVCSKLLMPWLWLRWEEADWCFFIIYFFLLTVIDPEKVEWTHLFFFFFFPATSPASNSLSYTHSDESCSPVAYNQNHRCLAPEQLDWCKLPCLKDHSDAFEPYLYSVCVKQRYVNAPYTWWDQCIL